MVHRCLVPNSQHGACAVGVGCNTPPNREVGSRQQEGRVKQGARSRMYQRGAQARMQEIGN